MTHQIEYELRQVGDGKIIAALVVPGDHKVTLEKHPWGVPTKGLVQWYHRVQGTTRWFKMGKPIKFP